MGRFILRYTGQGAAPAADLRQIRALSGMEVLDDSLARMVLVQAPSEVVDQFVKVSPNWISTAERMVPLPDTRVKVRSSPSKKS